MLGLLVSLSIGLTACGGGSGSAGSPPTSGAAAPGDAALRFAQCMRQHGVNVADPAPGATTIQVSASAKSDPKYPAADAACQHFLTSGGSKNLNDPAQQDHALALARCLRGHGLSIADPQPGQPLQLKLNSHDPQTMQIIQACRTAGG